MDLEKQVEHLKKSNAALAELLQDSQTKVVKLKAERKQLQEFIFELLAKTKETKS